MKQALLGFLIWLCYRPLSWTWRFTSHEPPAMRDALRDGAFGAVSGERYRRELDVLSAQRELARYNLRLLENASMSAWTELKRGADEAWERMREAAGVAGSYFEKRAAKPERPARASARPAAKRKRKAR